MFLQGFEPEAFTEVIKGGRFEHNLLGASSLSATLERVASDGIVVDRGHYEFETVVRGGFRPDWLCFGMVDCPACDPWVNGRRIRRDDLQVYAEGSELLYRSGVDTTWVGLQTDREALQRAARRCLGRELELPQTGDANLPLADEESEGLRRCIGSVFMDAAEGVETDKACVALLEAVAEAYASVDRPAAELPDRFAEQRRSLVARAIALMKSGLIEGYDSGLMCRTLGVSERSLQLCFRQSLGMSPSRWFTCMRLNAVRNALIAAESHSKSVTSVAMRHGFQHLGRFAQSYRELFGESPSATLRVTGTARTRG